MGLVREMAGMMTKVAGVRAAIGDVEDAVEILACVLADPSSSQQLVTESVAISDAAEETLAELKKELDPDAYAAACARGRARRIEVAVKELLTGPTRERSHELT